MSGNKNKKVLPKPQIAMTPEMEQQFESELCWCIQQLQTGLKSGKLNNKQEKSYLSALNTLMNNNTSIVHKRQVMRLSFDDYRKKMAEEEKKLSKAITKTQIKPAAPNKNSMFYKKSHFVGSDNNFRFNFKPPLSEEGENTVQISDNSRNIEFGENTCEFQLNPSKSEFKFNFSINDKT